MAVFDLARSDDRDFHFDADFCVVGAGLAGLTTAWRLAASGRRVVVLEGGAHRSVPLDGGFSPLVAPTLNGHALAESCRGLGGGSVNWGGRLIPLTAHDLQARPYAGIEAWPLDASDLARHTEDVESLFHLDHSSFEVNPAPLSGAVSPASDREVRCRFPKTPTFANRNLATALVPALVRRQNVEIWLNATVCSFSLDRESGRIGQVLAQSRTGRRLRVSARVVFIAAGTFETTRLLLHLDRLSDGRAFAGCDALGAYFQDHLRVELGRLAIADWQATNRLLGQRQNGGTRRSIHFELSPEAQQEGGIASAYLDIRVVPASGSPLGALRAVGRGRQGGATGVRRRADLTGIADPRFLARAVYWRLRHGQIYLPPDTFLYADLRIEQPPRRSNRLRLSESHDPSGLPLLALEWSPGEFEERTFAAASERFGEYWRRHGMDRICPIVGNAATNGAQPFIARCEETHHPAGSTRMGLDPAHAVVDSYLRCHAVGNLSLASASTFPSSGSANPSMTLLQLALRAADARIAMCLP